MVTMQLATVSSVAMFTPGPFTDATTPLAAKLKLQSVGSVA
jgi:hypothetical protein